MSKKDQRNLTKGLLQALLNKLESRINILREENERLRKSQIEFRDHVAAKVYPKYIDVHSNYEQAASDAYAAADALIRQRDLNWEFVDKVFYEDKNKDTTEK